jgi:hypothetical protein
VSGVYDQGREPDAGFSGRSLEDLRRDAAVAGHRLMLAYVQDDMVNFHLGLGILQGLVTRIYEANAREEVRT